MQIFKIGERIKRIAGIIAEIIVGVVLFSVGGCETLYFKDSETFLFWSTLNYRRGYTLYPLFIKFCRIIFGETNYIDAIWIVQSILALISILVLTEYFRKEYELNRVLSGLVYMLLYLPYTFTLPEAMATHYIFTEGIAITFFYLAFLFVLCLLNRITWYNITALLVTDYLLFLIRPQLIIFIPVEFFILFLFRIYKRHLCEGIRQHIVLNIVVFVVVLFFVGTSLVVLSYYLYDRAVENQLIDAISGKIICTMKENDVVAIDEKDRYIFGAIYEFADRNDTLMADFPQSLLEYEDIHVAINMNSRGYEQVVWKCIEEYYPQYDSLEPYRARNRVLSKLLRYNLTRYLGVVFRLMPSSMVAAIFIQPQAYRMQCYLFVLLIYFFSLSIIVYTLYKGIDNKFRYPHISCVLIILINSLFCNITLYGQQRYVIYCMGLFYVTLLISLVGCYRHEEQ